MIRKTEEKDLDAVMAIIHDAVLYFQEKGIDQWQRGYPNQASIQKDIRDQSSYVYEENGRILGTCCIRFQEDPNYKVIENGCWLNDAPYGVIHRIAVKRECKGKRIGTAFLQYAEKLAKEQGISNLRVDTHEKNHSMQRMVEREGFQYCGRVYVGEHEPRKAYQKEL